MAEEAASGDSSNKAGRSNTNAEGCECGGLVG